MSRPNLYIIAAGNSTRMGGKIKALSPILGMPNITHTIMQAEKAGIFNKIYVVYNLFAKDQWVEYANKEVMFKNVMFIGINSGRGDGHAVLEALRESWSADTYDASNNEVMICWGDTFIPNHNLFLELYNNFDPLIDYGVIPVVYESNPYVSIKKDDNDNCTHVLFSKLGENEEFGYHDQSIFLFDKSTLELALTHLDASLNRGGKYLTTNSELSLLYVFHYLYNIYNKSISCKVYETKYPTMSYNTEEEINNIREIVSNE